MNAFFAVYGWYELIKLLLLPMPSPELDEKYTRIFLLSYFVNCTRSYLDPSIAPPPSPFHYKPMLAAGSASSQLVLALNQEEARLQTIVDQIQSNTLAERVQIDEEIFRLTEEADQLKHVATEGVRK